MDLGCLKGRAASRTGENDADDRRSLASRHEAISAGFKTDSTPALMILQVITFCAMTCASSFNKYGLWAVNVDQLG